MARRAAADAGQVLFDLGVLLMVGSVFVVASNLWLAVAMFVVGVVFMLAS